MGGVEGEPTSLEGLGGGRAGDMQWWVGKGGHRWTWTQVSQVSQMSHRGHTGVTHTSHTHIYHTQSLRTV